MPPLLGADGYALRKAAMPRGLRWRKAARWISAPSKRQHVLNVAPQSCRALAAIASKTGCASSGEREMTRRIAAVAACCSSASPSAAFSLRASTDELDFAAFARVVAFARSRDLPRGVGRARLAVFFCAFRPGIGPAPTESSGAQD